MGSSPIIRPIYYLMIIYFFLQSDYDASLAEITKLKGQIRDIKAQVGASTSQGSETWHDNIEHEELMRRHDLYMTHLRDKEQNIRHAKIVTPKQRSNRVQIGSRVTYEIDGGSPITIMIGSYRSYNSDPMVVSYVSPIAEALLNKKTGDAITANIADRERELTILAITSE